MKDIQNLMSILFLSRDFAHKAHLNTDSFAQHMALGEFYNGIIDLADSLAETWQGRNEEKIGFFQTLATKEGDPLDVLKAYLEAIQSMRSFAAKDTVISNIIDEIEQQFNTTIYKLKFLK